MRNFKDESFVGQFLSPKLMRDFRFFAIRDNEDDPELEVSAIHDDSGYRQLRESLSRQYDLNHREPNIQVWSVNLRGDRALTLRHTQHNDRPLHDDAQEVLKHVARLWGFDVHLESVDSKGRVSHRKVAAPAGPLSRQGQRGRRSLARAVERLCARMAILDVVVDQSHGLHEGIDRGRADEAPAPLLQILRHRQRLGRGGHASSRRRA